MTQRELGRGGKGVVLLVRHVLDGVSLGEFACKRVPVGKDFFPICGGWIEAGLWGIARELSIGLRVTW